jgi:thiol-disulfide isomerase/thioredoxin
MKFFSFLVFFIFLNNAQAAEIKDKSTLIIKTFDGKKFDLQEKIGKIVIINFFAQWCIDCRREIPLLEELYKEYQAQGLEIIGVSIDRKSDLQKLLRVTSTLNYPNSLFEDAEKNSFEKPKAIPLNYIIDKKGNIAATLSGDGHELSRKDFEDVIKPLLNRR